MSFSTETKNELSRIEERNENCRLAELAGFFRAAGSVGLAGSGRFKIVIATDNRLYVMHAAFGKSEILARLYMMLIPFITDQTLAVEHEYQSLSRRRMLR